MNGSDYRPLPNTPVSNRIRSHHNNRLGAAYSAMYTFWKARESAVGSPATNRRDAYSVILFNEATHTVVNNDFTSAPEALINQVLPFGCGGGTDYSLAIRSTQGLMVRNWSAERSGYT